MVGLAPFATSSLSTHSAHKLAISTAALFARAIRRRLQRPRLPFRYPPLCARRAPALLRSRAAFTAHSPHT
ncbi:hypothetical protein BU23DRAFT_122998 [Bimuria novae-zelandiae CBS 107.79]|uniref:Uncharacterized protein n=1 Tax=Bimuria novae-zelandiae CBS 107.79 TaxID=1447943 RepID=A0A6A5VL03_9PLEO|nr:hypothetical protein BU23DRAFT_122998 [Bimuria novae-zelandiae CBS 107.79]